MVECAYIHIPFCKSKCKYCSFVSFNRLELMEDYIVALEKEIIYHYQKEPLKTLYIGGGTPSLVPVNFLTKIISKFNFAQNYELTIEVNPDDASEQYFIDLKSIGVNRLSIGSQTFDDKILKLIGRRHSSNQIFDAISYAKNAGFDNISVDLIYGLPTQTIESLAKDIDVFLECNLPHLSTYGLKIEPESYWGTMLPANLPDDDLQADMYELINERLEAKDFNRYEVSNFAKKGFESKHNLNYWNNNEYYGFGVAAHGYIGNIRYSNDVILDRYIHNPCEHKNTKKLSKQEQLEESIFLGMRKTEGINVKEINLKYGIDFDVKYKEILDKYSEFMIKTQIGYSFNLKGTLVSNVILSEFLQTD